MIHHPSPTKKPHFHRGKTQFFIPTRKDRFFSSIIVSETMAHGWVLVLVLISVHLTLAPAYPEHVAIAGFPVNAPTASPPLSNLLPSEDDDLQYEFYRDKCPEAENIVRSTMARILLLDGRKNATPEVLRLLFHDCFIQGCDASVLLDNNGNKNYSVEKDAIPNKTLKAFNLIDIIKQELENACPGTVSCADILVLATRDATVLAGGPFYPILTGRKDSRSSYFAEALSDIPRPDGSISETLRLFSRRGFSTREIVALLGAHNIGRISCEFIEPRLHNFLGTGLPDQTMPADFLNEMTVICSDKQSNSSNTVESAMGISYNPELLSSVSSGSVFGTQYYQSLLRGRGLLFADQQLMANKETADLVRAYASDDGTTFRLDFSRAMMKMSNVGVLTGSRGEVRLNCSRILLGSN
ncbi:putative Peroxidase 48 [Diospyros lotus]|uniref:putative Peroxidase 48 n=1 Tax=Diospyros lotus TaxID=55363 RepID=UPI00224E2DFE|nr:putative Peroxidase 48 [Diospyros lotus]